VVRLALRADVAARLRASLERTLRRHGDEDLVLARDGLAEARTAAEALLAGAAGDDRGLDLRLPGEFPWDRVAGLIDPDIRYRGEIARRGFMQRLGEGRRLVFVGLMIVSLVGGFVGFNVRRAAWAGVACLVAFVGAVAYTYRSWRRDDRELVEREMEKVRAAVTTELARVATDVLRESQAWMQQALEAAKAQALVRLEELDRRAQIRKATRSLDQKRESRARLKAVDQRTKALSAIDVQLAKARAAAHEALTAARAEVRGAVAATPREPK
jgi:hypothetical protein